MTDDRAPTGIAGLDSVLMGGFPRDRIYLVDGDPGAGKTTLALQFLLAGVAAGERVLYITLSETETEIRLIADSHEWSLQGISMFELSALEQQMCIDSENTIFHPSDIELTETTRTLLKRVDEIKPQRVVFDSLSELRLLAQSQLRYRREVLNLKQYFAGKHCTVMLLDDRTSDPNDMQLQSLAHGVLSMEQLAPEYGGDRRRLRVTKLRGSRFRSGYHDFIIETGGLAVYPRLVAAEHHVAFKRDCISSGLPELDRVLGGGIHRGTSTLFLGPAGAGKSAITAQYATAAAERGECSVIFAFDELRATALARAESLGLQLGKHVESGRVIVQQIDPAEMSPGELAHRARDLVENRDVKLVVIDSLNGYLHAMPAEQYLYIQLHEMLSYFGRLGVTTLMVMAQAGLVGNTVSPVDVSYIADNVLLLRYFEAEGRVRKAISMIKKRTGPHEDTIRELSMDSRGLTIGRPLSEFRGILTTAPEYHGAREKLDAHHS
ncbi:MAG: circadian clock protein KaiC [Myxococcales bacterium]|nr:circadian clock protein KaiC [Myxococcales bacterium]